MNLNDIYNETETIRKMAKGMMPKQVKNVYVEPVMNDADELTKYEITFMIRVGTGATDILIIRVDFPVECWDDYLFLEERLRQLKERWFGGDI